MMNFIRGMSKLKMSLAVKELSHKSFSKAWAQSNLKDLMLELFLRRLLASLILKMITKHNLQISSILKPQANSD